MAAMQKLKMALLAKLQMKERLNNRDEFRI